MDMGDFESAIAKAKALMKSLNGDANIKIGTDLDKASVAKTITQVTSITDSFHGANIKIGADVDMASVTSALAKIEAVLRTAGIAGSAKGAAGAAAGAAGGALIGGAFWGITANALHWIIAGGAEILAVTVPAIVALGAGLAVMAPAAQNAAAHMQALFTATSADGQMFGQTAGDVLGLGHALQTAQDAAQPAVYGMLGSALIAVKGHMGELTAAGSQVTRMFQTFAARVAVDFGPGGSLGNKTSSLLSHMTQDLQGLGQVLGNTGHAFVNFASSMPGLAEFLLKIVDGVTGLASHLTGVAGPLLTVGMGFEEFNRWGGLAATILSKLGLATVDLQGGAFTLTRFKTVVQGLLSIFPTAIAEVAKFAAIIGATGAAQGLTGAAEGLAGAIEKITPLGALLGVGAAVGLGFLIDKLITAQNATQAFVASLQAATQKSSNIQAFQQIAQNVAQLNQALGQSAQVANSANAAVVKYAGGMRGISGTIANQANQNVQQLNAGLTQQQQELVNVAQGASFLAQTYHTSLVGALALADAANVKLANGITGTSQAAQIARMQIASYVTGMQAMGAPLTAVGSDLTVLAIQSGLASTQVSKLNQGWDQFMQNLTGGTSGLAGFVTSLSNMTSVVASFHNNLGKALSIKDSVTQFAAALKNFGTSGAAAWQNFDQVVGSTAPQLIDWLRTAGAEGALSGDQFTKAVLGMVSSLTQFASQSPTAQAELLGLVQQVDPNIQTWGQLTSTIKTTGVSLKNTQDAVQSATKQMGDMAQVAQNLGTVMQSALLTTLSQAKIGASGAGQAMQQYEQDIMNAGSSATKTAGDRAALISDLEKLGYSAKQAAQLIGMVTSSINAMPSSKTVTINVVTKGTGNVQGTGGSTGGGRGYASGTPAAPAGWAWVGEAGPELVKFRGGEQVLPNQVSRGFAEGAYAAGPIVVQVHLDGRQVASVVAKRGVQTQRRTGTNGMAKRTR